MADVKKEITEFTAYEFDAEDYAVAVVFNEMQLKHIQTQLAKYAQLRVNMSAAEYPSAEIYIRAQEYGRGLMDGMKYLIELHMNYREAVSDLIRDRIASQTDDFLDKDQPYVDENNMRGGG